MGLVAEAEEEQDVVVAAEAPSMVLCKIMFDVDNLAYRCDAFDFIPHFDTSGMQRTIQSRIILG